MSEFDTAIELLNIELPKWPQMLVRGQRITPEQALEVIRRTDAFFTHGYTGNNHDWNVWVKNTVGMPLDAMDLPRGTEIDWQSHWEHQSSWKETWGVLDTTYVSNCWISSAYIYGPHGWCHPDGTIAHVDNIGKWPSVEEVYQDWKKIAEAFPFLVLDAVLMSGEGVEENITPLVGFRVRGDTVTVLPGDTPDWFAGFEETPVKRDMSDALFAIFGGREDREIGITRSVIQRWAAENRARNPELYAEG